MSIALAPPSRPAMLAVAASERLLKAERVAVAGFMGLLTALILVNVVTRYGGFPIYWIDEMAVYTTVWLTFIGASAMTRLRLDFAVTLLTEHLSPGGAKAARALSTLCVLVFALGFLAICWTWLDPIGIARAGFDARDYAAETFNFIYTEHTQTLNWPNWVLYLVLPIFAATLSIHCVANLLEDLGLAPPPPARSGLSENAETVA
ncbi:TRAP transporter small permease [Roseococcus sp. YIM B11640]|uniref:TRAP transporter small permease n=1 Tax=Roseococcus sp. YIM B11640 TaxID=3133973 RepID=UPI003C7D33A2